MNDGKVISFCSFKCSNTMTFGAEGTGFDTYNLLYLFFTLFCKASLWQGGIWYWLFLAFLKSLNEMLCSVILEKRKVFASVRNSLSNIILQEKNSILTYNSWIRAFGQIISLLFPSIRNCFMCWLSFTSNEYF